MRDVASYTRDTPQGIQYEAYSSVSSSRSSVRQTNSVSSDIYEREVCPDKKQKGVPWVMDGKDIKTACWPARAPTPPRPPSRRPGGSSSRKQIRKSRKQGASQKALRQHHPSQVGMTYVTVPASRVGKCPIQPPGPLAPSTLVGQGKSHIPSVAQALVKQTMRRDFVTPA
jgi:hypothetical protein